MIKNQILEWADLINESEDLNKKQVINEDSDLTNINIKKNIEEIKNLIASNVSYDIKNFDVKNIKVFLKDEDGILDDLKSKETEKYKDFFKPSIQEDSVSIPVFLMISDVPEEQLNSIKYKAIQLREYSKGLSTEECYTYKDYFRKDYGIFDCICFYTTSEQSLSNREEDENSERQYGKMNVCFVVKIKVFV